MYHFANVLDDFLLAKPLELFLGRLPEEKDFAAYLFADEHAYPLINTGKSANVAMVTVNGSLQNKLYTIKDITFHNIACRVVRASLPFSGFALSRSFLDTVSTPKQQNCVLYQSTGARPLVDIRAVLDPSNCKSGQEYMASIKMFSPK